MHRRTSSLLALAAGFIAAGCSDRPGPSPAMLRMDAATTVPTTTCSFTSMNPLVTHYFSGTTDKQVVSALIDAMKTAFQANDVTTTRDRGFDVMTHIATQVKAGNADFQDASALTNALLACMLFSSAELPATFPEDFTTATNPALDGGYDVRGEPPIDPDGEPGQRVYARPAAFNALGFPTREGFSGLAPALMGSNTPFSWSQIIHTVTPPTRVLLYGKPGPNSQSYDWRAVPRTVSYLMPGLKGGPGALVGLCVASTTTLVHESGTTFTGFNPFADAYFMDPGICQTFAFERSTWNPLRFANRLFSVPPVWANPGGVGGLIGGHSEFHGDVTQMTAAYTMQPRPNVTVCTPVSGQPGAGCPSAAFFTVAVATTGTGTRADGTVEQGGVGPATVHLTALDNNGTFGLLCQLVTSTTFVCDPIGDSTGTNITQSSGGPPTFAPATFTNLFFTKTGAERLVANAAIPNTSIAAQTTSTKVLVGP